MLFESRKIIGNIRAITTLLVVIGHTTRLFTSKGAFCNITPPYDNVNIPIMSVLTDGIYSFHMPLFFILSGWVFALCLETKPKYLSSKYFITNKFKRLLIPYLFWGVFVVIPVVRLLNLNQDSIIKHILKGLLMGQDCRHLWFLSSLFIVFLVSYYVYKLLQKCNHVLSKRLFVFLVLPLTILLHYFSVFDFFPKYFEIDSFTFYMVFFIIGVSSYVYRQNVIIQMSLIVILSILLGFVGILGVLIVILISILFNVLNTSFTVFEKNSMGIYLAHPIILYILFYAFGNKINAYILAPLMIIISVIVSNFVVTIIRRYGITDIIGEKP